MKLPASGWEQKPELTCAEYLGSARELEFGPKACCSTDTGGGKGTTWWAVLNLPVGPLQGGPVLVNRVYRLQCHLSLGLLPLERILWGLMSQALKLEKHYQEAMTSPWERKHQYVLKCYSFRCEN